MILRLLVLFLFLYIILILVYSFLSRGRKRGAAGGGEKGPGEAMVLDPQCQSYIPKSDALQRGEFYFCSEECARSYLSR